VLDAAKQAAISPVNVTASTTLNAAIRGLLTARLSDGILQDEIAEEVSTEAPG
jgi:hypothetical protein